MANSRFYSSIAQATTLSAPIDNSVTTINVVASTGFPGSFPYTLAVDYGAANEELVQVNSGGPTSFNVTRAIDGTSGTSHSTGAVVRHVSSARDFTDSRTHEASVNNVHGVTGVGNDLVGTTSTQTLSNKTLTRATGSLQRIDIFNTGAWTTSVIGDSTNPSPARFHVLDNEVSLNEMFAVLSNGAVLLREQAAEGSGAYKLRYLDVDGTTDRYAILAGGTTAISPDGTTTFPALDIVAPDTSTTKKAIRVAASGGGTERFTVWNDGRVDILGTSTSLSTFDVTGPASMASSYVRIMDSIGNTLLGVGNTTKTTLAGTADIKNDFHTGGVSTPVLRIFGRNPGQTGDLTQWVDASGTIVSTIDLNGMASFGNYNTTATTNVSGILTASTGWTITDQAAVTRSRQVTIYGNVTRTGANINADSSGNITDTDMCVLSASFQPNAVFSGVSALMPCTVTDGFGDGAGRLDTSTRIISMVSWSANGAITTGRNYRFTMSFHL